MSLIALEKLVLEQKNLAQSQAVPLTGILKYSTSLSLRHTAQRIVEVEKKFITSYR